MKYIQWVHKSETTIQNKPCTRPECNTILSSTNDNTGKNPTPHIVNAYDRWCSARLDKFMALNIRSTPTSTLRVISIILAD